MTWDKEVELLCPANKVGQVDILFVTGHGMSLSNSPPTAAFRPRVAVMQNGRAKGGEGSVVRRVLSYPGLEAFWYLHEISGMPALNGDAAYIANLDSVPDAGNSILLNVRKDGSFSVLNARTGSQKSY